MSQEGKATSSLSSDIDDSENFWKVDADDAAFWNAYVSTRPNYSASFYRLIYEHHSAHSDSWALAHDVGCGAGQVTAELATRFDHVVASDINATHLTVAQQRLTELFQTRQVSSTHAKGEDLEAYHGPQSADLIAAAEAIVLMDSPQALRSFARVLKPNGTLALWFYGRPTFSEADYVASCQPILDQIMVLSWRQVIRGSGPARKWGFKRAADGMASWLDYVDFNQDTWKDVRRVKWNRYATLPFFGTEACGFDIHPTSSIREGEEVVEHNDPKFWQNVWPLSGLKKYFSVLFPGFANFDSAAKATIDRLFAQIQDRVGNNDSQLNFTWPAVLVLATKR